MAQRFPTLLVCLSLLSTPSQSFCQAELEDPIEIARLQIFLDNHHFSPGSIDGRFGSFTQRALSFYNTQQQRDKTDWNVAWQTAVEEIPHVFTTHRISPKDVSQVGSVPRSVAAQAKLRALPYRSLLEYVAERYHANERFLQELNSGLNLYALKVGQLVVVPNVRDVFRVEELPEFQRYEADPPKSECHVLIDTTERMASIYRSTQILAAYPITHGPSHLVPRGRWEILNMITTPTFRWDKRMLKEGRRSKEYHVLPPGPNNPVGIFWAGINKRGIGLHGTDSPRTIGRSLSAGCIRFANWDAIRLPNFIRPGSEVIIR